MSDVNRKNLQFRCLFSAPCVLCWAVELGGKEGKRSEKMERAEEEKIRKAVPPMHQCVKLQSMETSPGVIDATRKKLIR